jgi:hypothetical protein
MMSSLLPLETPFTCLVAGPTQCGKTSWVARLLKEKDYQFSTVPQNVVWYYGVWQNAYDELRGLVNRWEEGLPKLADFDASVNNLVIIDDLMSEVDDSVTQLFTKGSHHKNISVIYLVQNLFQKGPHHRTISLNTHYLVLFKNPRDAQQINNLAKQMYPKNSKFLLDAFKDATSQAHGYLLIDLKQSTPDDLRIRTHIFKGEVLEVYLPRK